MKEGDIPLDLSFILELAKPPTLEEELHLEKEIRLIQSSDDLEGIKKYAEDCARQNHQQSIFIAGCLNKIAELQTRLIKLFEEKKKEPNLLGKILGL